MNQKQLTIKEINDKIIQTSNKKFEDVRTKNIVLRNLFLMLNELQK